jgi:hypothetical protein
MLKNGAATWSAMFQMNALRTSPANPGLPARASRSAIRPRRGPWPAGIGWGSGIRQTQRVASIPKRKARRNTVW